jgi:D-galactonate transporter
LRSATPCPLRLHRPGRLPPGFAKFPAFASIPVNTSATANPEFERATYAKVTWRLIPFLFICYIAAFLDRVNVGFAKLQMQKDLAFSDAVYGFGAGIFFIGYFLFEVPSNVILEKTGARIWIARIMITWGIISSLMMFVKSETWFYVARFFLGVAEAGFFPGIILYLTYWYPAQRRARMVALFMTAIAVTGVVGSPLSGFIMEKCAGAYGLAGWQWLFLLEGIPSVVIGVVVLFYLDDGIRSAGWLKEPEKALLEGYIVNDRRDKQHMSIGKTLANPWVLLFSLVYFCISMGLYGIGFWLPQIIKNTGVKSPIDIGLYTAIPYACAAIAMNLMSRSSDLRLERRWHFAFSAVAGGVGLIVSALNPTNVPLSLAALSVATAGVLSAFPISWTMPTAILAGTSAAAGIALVNSIGGLAGFVSPFIVGWISDRTHSPAIGLYVIAGSLFLGALLVVALVPARRAATPPS